MVKSAADGLGGLDIVVANAAWTRFEDKFGDLENGLTDDEWDKVRQVMVSIGPLADRIVLVHQCHASRAAHESGSSHFQSQS